MKNRISWLPSTFLALVLLGSGTLSALEEGDKVHPESNKFSHEVWHDESLAEAFDLPPGCVGVWGYGSGAVIEPVLGVLPEVLQETVKARFDQGQRLKDFESHEVEGARLYSLVFESGTGTQELRLDLPSDCKEHPNCFSTVLATYETQGLRIADFETRIVGGKRVWSAVFRPGNGKQVFHPELDASALTNLVGDAAAGLALADFERLGPLDGIPLFAAIFREGTLSQTFFPAQNAASFHATYHAEDNKGRHLRDVEIWSVAGEVKYSSLFSAGSGPDHLLVSLLALENEKINFSHTAEVFLAKAKSVDASKKGARLFDLEVPFESEAEYLLKALKAATPATATLVPPPSPPRQGGGVQVGNKDLTVPPPRPTPSHQGALHDSGTEIPP